MPPSSSASMNPRSGCAGWHLQPRRAGELGHLPAYGPATSGRWISPRALCPRRNGRRGGNLAGFCSWRPDQVVGLYIGADWTGRGVASALMDHAEEAIVAGGVRRIALSASAIALPFYERRAITSPAGATGRPAAGWWSRPLIWRRWSAVEFLTLSLSKGEAAHCLMPRQAQHGVLDGRPGRRQAGFDMLLFRRLGAGAAAHHIIEAQGLPTMGMIAIEDRRLRLIGDR